MTRYGIKLECGTVTHVNDEPILTRTEAQMFRKVIEATTGERGKVVVVAQIEPRLKNAEQAQP